MKKKYVAVMLGLVLSMSTASVYAAGNSAATAAESTDSSSDSSRQLNIKSRKQGVSGHGTPCGKPESGDLNRP